MLGSHLIKAWSHAQTIVAMSSAEAELTGIAKGATISLGLQSLCADLGLACRIQIFSDRTSAIGICRRRGLGRVRHLAVADLWIQERVRSKDFDLCKIPGKDNHADIMTKFVDGPTLRRHIDELCLQEQTGRPASAAHVV